MNDLYDTGLCGSNTVLFHRDHLPQFWSDVCFLFTYMIVIIISFFPYIFILQGSVETHLRYGGIFNNHVIANCLLSVPVKKNLKIGQ